MNPSPSAQEKAGVGDTEEQARLEKLESYKILDTEQEEAFDRITRIVAESTGVSISLVSLVDANRQWFKSRYGLDAAETNRDIAFCSHAIKSEDVMVVEDATKDERFRSNPLVLGHPNIRFYAGAPLVTPDGYKLGTLCAIDDQPGKLSDDHRLLLADLANLVIDEIELRYAKRAAIEANEKLQAAYDKALATQRKLEQQTLELNTLVETESRLRKRLTAEVALKDRFFSIIAHDLKSPFNALLGMTEMMMLLADNFEKEEFVDYSGRVNEAGRKVFELLENLLEWARFQMEKNDVSMSTVELLPVLVEVSAILRPVADQKGVHFMADIVPVTVLGNKEMLATVIRNLVANAIKFTKEGGRVSVAFRTEGDNAVIEVTDTGEGIDPTILPDLFAIDKKTTKKGTNGEIGTGLGLPLCHEMIEQMQGTCEVETEAGVGTTFRVTLPVGA